MAYVPAWYEDMATPAGGWTAGALLSPNYLRNLIARGGEEAPYYERIQLDDADIEGSFRAQTGVDIRTALRDVAPGFDPGPGPITVETLQRQVPNHQVRAAAKDEGPGMLALLAPAAFGIAAWAAAGGAGAAGASTAAELAASGQALMPPAIVAPEVSGFVPVGVTESGGTIFAAPELAASAWSGITAQQAASLGTSALKLAGAAAPALASSQLASAMQQRGAALPAGLLASNARNGGIVTEQQQQQAPQPNSGAVPPTFISSGGAGGVVLAIVAVLAIALMKG